MNTVKKLALIFGVATGAAVTIMALGKPGKKARTYFQKKEGKNLSHQNFESKDDSEVNYV